MPMMKGNKHLKTKTKIIHPAFALFAFACFAFLSGLSAASAATFYVAVGWYGGLIDSFLRR